MVGFSISSFLIRIGLGRRTGYGLGLYYEPSNKMMSNISRSMNF